LVVEQVIPDIGIPVVTAKSQSMEISYITIN
jgi:hypothetical protein